MFLEWSSSSNVEPEVSVKDCNCCGIPVATQQRMLPPSLEPPKTTLLAEANHHGGWAPTPAKNHPKQQETQCHQCLTLLLRQESILLRRAPPPAGVGGYLNIFHVFLSMNIYVYIFLILDISLYALLFIYIYI